MPFKKILKNAVSIVKDEPLNIEEKMQVLERRVNTKISQFEESMGTMHSIVLKLTDENDILKQENSALRQSLANRETVATSLLDGIKQRVVEPLMTEGKELAELVFEHEEETPDNSPRHIRPETELSKKREPIETRENKQPEEPKAKTIKWMRQKFGLSAQIEEKKMKTKNRKARKK